VIDAVNIAIFEAITISGLSGNAKFVIKIAMVNPMPPNIPAPAMCDHARSSGKRHRPIFSAI
jgi:hypothetical protein